MYKKIYAVLMTLVMASTVLPQNVYAEEVTEEDTETEEAEKEETVLTQTSDEAIPEDEPVPESIAEDEKTGEETNTIPSEETVESEKAGQSVSAENEEPTMNKSSAGDFSYSITDSGIRITGYTGDETELTIPYEINGTTITEIGENAFKGNIVLTKITIPDSVIKIDRLAFSECTNLSEIKLSSNLEELNGVAFYRCTSLSRITIPGSLATMNSYWYYGDARGPFFGCTGLKEITIEGGMEEIPSMLFQDCSGLEIINWPANLKVIGSYAFSNCSSLTEAAVPDGVTDVEAGAFADCTALAKIVLPDSVTKIDFMAFSGCSSLEEVTLSSNLEIMNSCAFKNCTSLTSITIPASLTTVNEYYNGRYTGPFDGCTGLTEATIAEGMEQMPRYLFEGLTDLDTVVIPESIKAIGDYAFDGCLSLHAVVYPGSEEDWNLVTIGSHNEPLGDAVFYFSGNIPHSMDKPVQPVLTAEPAGHKLIHLSWTYDGNASLLSSFILYRSFDGQKYSSIRAFDASGTEYTDKIVFNGASQDCYYKIQVFDKYGRTKISDPVNTEALSSDTEKPEAVMSPSRLKYAVAGDTYHFSGRRSKDNDAIAAYSWDFGDGTNAAGMTVSHVFEHTGSYTVTLTVTDVNGLSDSVSQVVNVIDLSEESGYTRLNLSLCNASDGNPVKSAELLIKGEGYEDSVVVPDGELQYILPNGDYTLCINAERYITRTIKINAVGGDKDLLVGLVSGSILSGSITSTELTYDEIIAAGIDVNAPGNQHIYKFQTTIKFIAGLKEYDLPAEVFKNENGEVVKRTPYVFGAGSGGSGAGSDPSGDQNIYQSIYGETIYLPNITVYPVTEQFFLIITGESHWLKEMYKVELFLNNDSQTDTIEQLTAELVLPEGMSFADMTGGTQNAEQQLGNLGHGENTSAVWYIRGDQEGEYNLTAKVHGVSMPYGEYIEEEYTTANPVKVYAGSALHLTITCPDVAERGKDYTVKFRLENVSDKSLYNLSFGITKAGQYKVMSYRDKDVWNTIEECDFGDEWSHKIDELAPGGYIEMNVATTIWFFSALEFIKLLPELGSFVDVSYYLTDVSVVTLEGSTTEIPYSIEVERAERDCILDWFLDELVSEFLKGNDVDLPGSLGDVVIEMIGDTLEISTPLVKTAKTILKFHQGETDHTLVISVDDGRGEDNSIYNDTVRITTGTDTQGIIDTLNGTKLKVKGSEVSINAKGPGSTKVKIGVVNSLGELEREYVLDVVVKDHQIGDKITLNKNSVTNKFYYDENEFTEKISWERRQELEAYKENPYQKLNPRFTFEMEGQTSDSEYTFVSSSDDLDKLLDETTVSEIELKGKAGNLIFSRESLGTIIGAAGEIEISVETIQQPVQDQEGVWNAYYTFKVKTTEGVVNSFNGKAVDVEVPFEIPSIVQNPVIMIEHIKDDGSVEYLPGVYDSDLHTVSFRTTGFSMFRIYTDGITSLDDGKVTGISLDQEELKVAVKKSKTLKAIVEPEDAEDKSVTWTSSNKEIATVDKNGKVTGVKTGFATVTAKTNDGSFTAECEVTVLFDDVQDMSKYYFDAVYWALKEGITTGTKPTKFDPDITCSRGHIVTFLWRLAGSPEPEEMGGFDDVPEGAWYEKAVYWAKEKGITTGTTPTTFQPTANCTRGHIVTFLWRYMHSPDCSDEEIDFKDVPKGAWYEPAVRWAKRTGVTTGKTPTQFDPAGKCTRGQGVLFLQRTAALPKPENP